MIWNDWGFRNVGTPVAGTVVVLVYGFGAGESAAAGPGKLRGTGKLDAEKGRPIGPLPEASDSAKFTSLGS